MIFTVIFTILSSVIGFAISLLPTGGLPAGVTSAFAYIVTTLTVFNYIFPIDTLFSIVIFVATLHIALNSYGLSMLVLRLVVGRNRTPH